MSVQLVPEKICRGCGKTFGPCDPRRGYCTTVCKRRSSWQRQELSPEAKARRRESVRKWHRKNYPTLASKAFEDRVVNPWKYLLYSTKGRAKATKIPFDLTEEWARARWTGNCELTDLPFEVTRRKGSSRVFSPSIDRIDAKLGYVQSNCRFILWAANALKGDGTDADLFKVAEAIVKARASQVMA